MRRKEISLFMLLLFGITLNQINAQNSTSTNLVAQPIPDRTVSFSVTGTGVSKPITWGLDLAWLSEGNIRRGLAFMGADRVDVVRSSFIPTDPVVNGQLTGSSLTNTNERIRIINAWFGSNTKVVLNCDHPSINSWYSGNAANWAQLIDVTRSMHQQAGRTVTSVSPFNEPDYTTAQGTISDFYNICGVLKNNSNFNNIRICGGNTLNNDQALTWYNYLKVRLDEGNTHQLAGTFDNYANFYTTVRANGDHATNDELHNVMEAMVGVEYGMQTGIWWGTAELARGEFVKASDGTRLGYAEHRPNWTAASVYRNLDGKVQAFGGTSERQAATTTYRFVSTDKDVYYDGYGPQREYTMILPGGSVGSYQNGQTNAEQMINITWGEDIQPAINGIYKIVNRNSGKVLEVPGGSTTAGTLLQQNTNNDATYQQWNTSPVDSRVGGDFSYFTITAVHSGKAIDVLNWSLDNGGVLDVYDDTKSALQQWYLEYSEDGWFYIRSRFSAKCITVYNSSTADGASIVQWDKNGGYEQQWRLIPVTAPVEFDAPNAPINLVATANAECVFLNWTASSSSDVAGYNIYRAESVNGIYNTIARKINGTSFVDNTATINGQYYYKIKAVDNSLNHSAYSNEVSAITTGFNTIVADYKFDGTTLDNTINLNNCATYGSVSYVTGKVGSNAISLNGTNTFIQLPATPVNQQSITISSWIYWKGGNNWQRIFDFGNDQNQYMFLSPKSGSGNLRFAIKNGGSEQFLDAPVLSTNTWVHVAITMGTAGVYMYVNGSLVAQSTSITIRPVDFKPVLNYIGRSQYPDPLLNGYIDDFRIYNYALSSDAISSLAGTNTAGLQSGHIYTIKSRHSDKVIDVLGSTNGSSLIQFDNWNNPNQKWMFEQDNTGYWSLTPQNATSRALNVPNCSFTNGLQMNIWDALGNDCQKFQVTNLGTGYYAIKVKDGSKCLDVYNWSLDNNGIIALWDCSGGYNQQWSLIDYGLKSGTAVIEGIESEFDDNDKNVQISAFPNPVENDLTIKINNFEGAVTVEIYSIDGRLQKQTVHYVDKLGNISIPSWGFKGIGLVKVSTGQQVKILKMTF
jgi:hypothetical protein